VALDPKVRLGQFYTRVSPFQFARFRQWLRAIPNYPSKTFVEPFSGSNSIIRMILDEFPDIRPDQWHAFDISPEAQQNSLVPEVRAEQRDTILSFPSRYDICITNPPYLAKNSASRKHTPIEFGSYQDLFEVSVSRMLDGCDFIAAIIPESFITRGIFHERLEFVISLTQNMFDDTEFPVCLAVFSDVASSDFEVWRNDSFLGLYSDLQEARDTLLQSATSRLFRFNDPRGDIGLYAVDMTKGPSIRFVSGPEIDEREVKHSSRAITRISSKRLPLEGLTASLINEANATLLKYRAATHDVFLTSFKGLRDDQLYRRRLDWDTASRILTSALYKLRPELVANGLTSPKFPW
jgi:hypothetical protein